MLKKTIDFITDLVVINNGDYNDVIATIVKLQWYDELGYVLSGVRVMYMEEYIPLSYKRHVKFEGLCALNSSIPPIILSEDLIYYKNIIRIQRIDKFNYYVTIGYDLLINHNFTRKDSLLRLYYDYNSRDVTILSNECITTQLGKSAIAWFDSNKEALTLSKPIGLPYNGVDLHYYLLDNNQCFTNLNATIPNIDNNTSEIVWNDIIGASINTPRIKLVKCDDSSVEIYPSALSNITEDLIGSVVNIYGHYDCCFLVKRNDDCILDDYDTEYVLITNIYQSCRECNGLEINNIPYDLVYSTYRPAVNVGNCDVDKYIFTTCKFAEAVYKKYVSEVYKVKTCCPDVNKDILDKWWIKYYLIDLQSKENNLCDIVEECKPLCITNIDVVGWEVVSIDEPPDIDDPTGDDIIEKPAPVEQPTKLPPIRK